MIERLICLMSGYVRILVKGTQTERFLNLCRSRNIAMGNIVRKNEQEIIMILSVQDFLRLRPIRSKTKVHIRILQKHGLPFFFYRNKKRKAFFLGIFLCLGIMILLSLRIWNIHIQGNIRNSTPEILEFLDTNGITHGMAKSSVNCHDIAALIRKAYPDVTWVSARIQGTRLIINIQEGILQEQEHDKQNPCNLSAEHTGTIVKMVTRKGIPLKKVGETCEKGELLVSGELHILNDSQEIIRYEYVHADADIYISRSLSYYQEFPMEYEQQIVAGKAKKGFFLKTGNIFLGFNEKAGKNQKRTVEEYPLRLTENFILPFSVGVINLEEYRTIHAVYTESQARELALQKLHLYEQKLIEKGMEISENHIALQINKTTCISKGTLEIIEKTGKETPVVMQAQPSDAINQS